MVGENELDPTRGVYGISVAADLVGSAPQNLRLYEAKGLLTQPGATGAHASTATTIWNVCESSVVSWRAVSTWRGSRLFSISKRPTTGCNESSRSYAERPGPRPRKSRSGQQVIPWDPPLQQAVGDRWVARAD